MDINKIKEIKEPSRFKKFLKSYCSNLWPVLFFAFSGFLLLYTIISIGAMFIGSWIHPILCLLGWVGFKTILDGDF